MIECSIIDFDKQYHSDKMNFLQTNINYTRKILNIETLHVLFALA